jgi:hypothetical protein
MFGAAACSSNEYGASMPPSPYEDAGVWSSGTGGSPPAKPLYVKIIGSCFQAGSMSSCDEYCVGVRRCGENCDFRRLDGSVDYSASWASFDSLQACQSGEQASSMGTGTCSLPSAPSTVWFRCCCAI